jgi:hypothetical protein
MGGLQGFYGPKQFGLARGKGKLSFKFLLQTFELKLNRNQIHFRIQTSSNTFQKTEI